MLRLISLLTFSLGLPLLVATETVDSIAALEAAVNKAKPGTTVILKDGVYSQPLKLVGKGRQDEVVTVRSESLGGVQLEKPVALGGAWLSLEGVAFREQGSVSIKGVGIRLSRATFSNCDSSKWVEVAAGSKQVEVDYCLFENKQVNLKKNSGCQLLRLVVHNKQERHHIHHNHFRNIPKGKNSNGYETVQLITNRNPFDPPGGDCETRIEHNLFEKCNGESEIISVKSNGNQVRYNTFRECRGGLVLRHGHRNRVEHNYFDGGKEPRAEGVRLQGREQVVANNYFNKVGSALILMDGTPDKLYVRVEKAKIHHNVIVDCDRAMVVGRNHSKHPNGTAPKECVIHDNVFYQDGPRKSGLIEFVQGDQPVDWSWMGNRYRGDLGIAPVEAGLEELAAGSKIELPKLNPLSAEKVGPEAE